MKAEEGGLSRFGALAGALTKLSYHYHMVMPGYIILFIRTFLTLEGIAGVVRPDFNIYEASLPYAMQRALSPKTKAAVAALRQNFVTETGSPQWETLDALVSQAEAEGAEASDNTNTAAHATSGAEANSASSSSSSSSSSSTNYAEVLQRVLASPQGSALRRIFADLDAQQLLQGLAGKKGRPLRDLASNALAERLRVSLRFPWRRPQSAHAQSAHSATAVQAPVVLTTTPTAPTAYERRQRERREKSMKIIGGLQLQRFRGRAAAVALVAALTITFRVSFWAVVKAFRFSASKKFSNARPAE